MVPTTRGAVALATGVALFALAWLTRVGWFYMADALLWGVLLVNLVLPPLMVKGLAAQRKAGAGDGMHSGDIFEDGQARIELAIESCSHVPKLFVAVRERCPVASPEAGDMDFLIATLGSKSRAHTVYEVRCDQRGVYSFPPLDVSSTAPFGLFRARRSLPAPLELTVYPQVLPFTMSAPRGLASGSLPDSPLPQQAGEVRGSREYQPGDRLRGIHWRNSARRGQLMVKELDQAPQGELCFAFDPGYRAGDGRDSALEYSVKIAASLAYRCFQEGRPFRLRTPSDNRLFLTWHATLEHLARVSPDSKGSPSVDWMGSQGFAGTTVAALCVTDAEAMRALMRSHRLPGYTVAVVFEGFGLGDGTDGPSSLALSGIQAVHCRPGGLRQALESLGRALTTPERPASGGRPRLGGHPAGRSEAPNRV